MHYLPSLFRAICPIAPLGHSKVLAEMPACGHYPFEGRSHLTAYDSSEQQIPAKAILLWLPVMRAPRLA